MTKKIKMISLALICLIFSLNFSFLSLAKDESNNIKQGIYCVSFRGDTALYEQNSKEAVLSAFSKGADFVSVNIRQDDKGVLVLCSENEETVSGISLSEILSLTGEDDVLILDFEKELKDKVYELLKKENALSKSYLRIKDSAKNLNSWIASKDETPTVIGVCGSFNIFTILNFTKEMTDMPMIDLRSKNYFNVMYGSLCYEKYSQESTPIVIAPMYDPDLCGQRSDSEDGWNDLIKKNFNVIETNNLDSFISYRDNILKLKDSLSALLIKAETIDMSEISSVSQDNLLTATQNAKSLINEMNASCDELEKAHSSLLLSINTITNKQGEDTKKGALNITAGKIVAAVLVGFSLLAAEVFINKMQKEKKR